MPTDIEPACDLRVEMSADNDESPPRLFQCKTAGPPGFARPLSIRERVRESGYPWQRRMNRLHRMQRIRRRKRSMLRLWDWAFGEAVFRGVIDRPTGPLGTDGNEYEPIHPDDVCL